MRVIVTGGSGRIGGAVVKTLAERGHEVWNLDRRPPVERPGRFIYMDLRRRDLLQPVMEQAETIIHMGEIPSARTGHNTEEEVYASNCAAGSLVMQLASELKYRRVLYTSTIQVYGFMDMGMIPPATLPVDENHPLRPQNAYSLGKVAVENYARFCAQKKGLSIAAFRLPWVMTDDVAEHRFGWIDKQTKLDSDLGIYVKDSDVAECFAMALEPVRPGFEAYNLSAREAMTGIPLREGIARDFPSYPQLPEGWGKYDTVYLYGKAREHFGWEPKWSYLELFRQKMGRDPRGYVK
jgi:nucleoside-diphosphate-sugar epimerase